MQLKLDADRIIKAYITFHMQRDANWDAKAVTQQTPFDIWAFITQKCGPVEAGFEGRKASILLFPSTIMVTNRTYLLLISFPQLFQLRQHLHCGIGVYDQMRALLNGAVMRKWAPGESHLGTTMAFMLKSCSHGIPTRSRTVSEFMISLKKTKARAGEVSQSACALSLEDMHRLHDFCFDPKLTDAQKRWGAIWYVSCDLLPFTCHWQLVKLTYLLAFLMILRIEEAISIQFESIDMIPVERR